MEMQKTMNESTPDTPIVVLEQNRKFLKMAIIFAVGLLILDICHIVPVVMAGTYSAGLADLLPPVKRFLMFWCSLFAMFFLPYFLITAVWHLGNFSFYSDRLEFASFWFDRKIRIPYNKMYVNFLSNGVIISTTTLPSWRTPLKRIRAQYNAVAFPMIFDDRVIGNFTFGISRRWLNPQDGPKAVQILKERGFSVNYK
jgi:hypothetical protein